jgi:hypothetical protein
MAAAQRRGRAGAPAGRDAHAHEWAVGEGDTSGGGEGGGGEGGSTESSGARRGGAGWSGKGWSGEGSGERWRAAVV